MLTALSLGIGLLVELACGRRLPGALLPAVGMAGLICAAGLATSADATAELATPLAVFLAVAGFGFAWPWRGRRPDGWAVGAALAVFAVYAAPVVLSGEATFAGYVKLDDTATWLAFTDQVMAQGHSTSGLDPSSFEATVQINFSQGYPLGAFLPLGVGTELTGADAAWLFQPTMALMAAFMALSLWHLVGTLVRAGWAKALAVFFAAQAPLLFGYSLWGGIKEVITAMLLAVLAATAGWLAEPGPLRRAVPAAAVCGAALVVVMGAGGAPWVGAVFLLALALAWRRIGPAALWPRVLLLLGIAAVVALPTILAAGSLFSPTQGGLTSEEELGNLVEPLRLVQLFGPWPVGDFRFDPDSMLVAWVLVAATAIAWALGLAFAARKRSWPLLIFAAGTGLGSLAVWLVGSPWVQGKALATGTVSFLVLATVGIAAAILSGPAHGRWMSFAGLALLIVPAGVLISNAYAFHDVYLAPRPQLAELERIGEEVAGEGPALMTEYQPYGVRHFLRDADPEGLSELRRRTIPLTDGTTADKGAWADTDQISLPDLLVYRTLVLRRTPGQSRPPSPYELLERGDYYEVWQRPSGDTGEQVLEHLPLGGPTDPSAVPRCPEVRRLAGVAGPGGALAAAPRKPTAVARFGSASNGWILAGDRYTVTPDGPGEAVAQASVSDPGEYEVYTGGSARQEVELTLDGESLGTVWDRVNNNGQYLEFDEAELDRGTHTLTLSLKSSLPLRPGSGGPPSPLGPIVLSPVDGRRPTLTLPASTADELCGMRLDWVEAIAP